MIISAHQPAYLPWLGYIDKIKRSDVFVFLDSVQYEKNSFTNRNLIKSSNGPIWLSIPVIKTNHFNKTMIEMKIDNKSHWQRKHLNSIRMCYSKAANFKRLYPLLEDLYSNEYDNIADVTWSHLMFWIEYLGIHTRIIKSSSLNILGKKSDFVFELCEKLGANYYISGINGKDYIDINKFTERGIVVEFQDYKHPIYPQLYGDFLPNMGIVDIAMNESDYSII